MDGVKQDIPGHFKNIFGNLYNSAGEKEELLKVLQEVEDKIDVSSLDAVDLVTPDIVREAAKNLNESKSDPQLNFSSDCIKNPKAVHCIEKLSNSWSCYAISSPGNLGPSNKRQTRRVEFKQKLQNDCHQ